MFTCFIKYVVDPNKLAEFERYARTWMRLVEKYGGIHHGYFLPGGKGSALPEPTFSFPCIGKSGEDNIAVALFSFPNVERYDAYRKAVAEDEKCKEMTAYFNETKCFLSYERSFLKPLFNEQ